jgi:hypothetical protein
MAVTQPIIKFGIYDVTAKDDAVYSDAGMQSFIDTDVLKRDGYVSNNYATCELNNWLLNGLQNVPPTDLSSGRWGIISSATADVSCNLPAGIYLKATFITPHTSAGITLRGSNGVWCSEVQITWYNSTGGVIQQQTYYPNEIDYFAELLVENYYAVRVDFIKTNRPDVFVYLDRIGYGAEYIFESDELKSANTTQEISPISECVAIGQLNFSAIPKTGSDSFLRSQGVFAAMQAGQLINVSKIVDDIQSQVGKYYLDDWDATGSAQINLKCVDIVGMLSKHDCAGGLFNAVALSTVVSTLFAGIEATVIVADNLQATPVSGWIPVTDYRTVLQYICFAVGAIVLVRADGSIYITLASEEVKVTIGKNRMFINPKIERRKETTDVEVIAYSYTQSTEQVELINQTYAPGEYTIYFNEPIYNLICTGATITTAKDNYAIFTVATQGVVNIKGKTYNSNQTVSRVSRNTPLAGGTRTYIKAKDCTLVSSLTSEFIAQNIYEYYSMGQKITFKAILEDEVIADTIRCYASDMALVIGFITKLNTNLIGFVTTYEVVGNLLDITQNNEMQRAGVFYAGAEAII